MKEMKKQHPRTVSSSTSSSLCFATDLRSLGTRTKPRTSVTRKKTPSPPSESAAAPIERPLPLATPVATAMVPTQTMSSQTDVPTTYLTKGRSDHLSSPMIFTRSVVAESQMATPRKSEGTEPHPKTLEPTV